MYFTPAVSFVSWQKNVKQQNMMSWTAITKPKNIAMWFFFSNTVQPPAQSHLFMVPISGPKYFIITFNVYHKFLYAKIINQPRHLWRTNPRWRRSSPSEFQITLLHPSPLLQRRCCLLMSSTAACVSPTGISAEHASILIHRKNSWKEYTVIKCMFKMKSIVALFNVFSPVEMLLSPLSNR